MCLSKCLFLASNVLNMCLIRLLFCFCKLITIALIVATSVYFQVVDVIVNEKLTHVIDEIDTIEKNIEI